MSGYEKVLLIALQICGLGVCQELGGTEVCNTFMKLLFVFLTKPHQSFFFFFNVNKQCQNVTVVQSCRHRFMRRLSFTLTNLREAGQVILFPFYRWGN